MIRRIAPRTKPRRGPLREPGYRAYINEQPCTICSRLPSDAAHTQNNGMSSKGPDSSCAPLCREHHREYDSGRLRFEQKYSVDMKRIAALWWCRYQDKGDRSNQFLVFNEETGEYEQQRSGG